MLSDDALDTLVSGTFSIECLRIRLTRNGTGVAEYEGPGEIRQVSDGSLVMRAFDVNAKVQFPKPWTAGELIPESDYCTMDATAIDGKLWRSTYVLPDPSWAMGGIGCVVSASLNEITSEEPELAIHSPRMELLFPSALRIPPTSYSTTNVESGAIGSKNSDLDTSEFDAAGMTFHCRVHRDRTKIMVRATEFPVGLDTHIIEALQFLLGREVRYVHSRLMVDGSEITTVRSINRTFEPRLQPSIQPPIALRFPNSTDAWKLFDCYLRMTLAAGTSDFHPISIEWETVIHGEIAGLEGQALLWAVAVEAILAHVDEAGAQMPPTLSDSEQEVVGWLEKAKEALNSLGCPPKMLKRITGPFKGLFELSPTARLRRLAQNGAIDESTISSWSMVRNTRAHGAQGNLKSPSEVLASRDAILALLYQLVFYHTKYSGAAIAYHVSGWPQYVYPEFPSGEPKAETLGQPKATS